jgi:hypothetical protein
MSKRDRRASGALASLNLDWQGQIVGINPPNPSISNDASRVGFTALSTRPLVQHPNEYQTDSLVFDTSSNGLASVRRSSTAAWVMRYLLTRSSPDGAAL